MARATDSAGGRLDVVSAVVEMIGASRTVNLRAVPAADAFGIVGHVENRTDQERLVTKAPDAPNRSCVHARIDSMSRSAAGDTT